VVGPAHQGADFRDVNQDRHIAALTAEPPFADELAIQDQTDDLLAHAEGELGRFGDVDWPALATFTGLAPASSRSRKASRSSGANWSAAPVVGAVDPRDDQAGPVSLVVNQISVYDIGGCSRGMLF
jgi:hypothetical protein